MAGIKIAPGRHSQILRSGAAARKPLGHARSLAQIQHKVEEFKTAAFLFPLYKFLCQTVVLLHDLGKVLFTDGIRSLRRRYNWLHRQLFKAQVCKVQYVIGKVQVVSRKGPSYEIILISSGFREFLEFRNDQVIASRSVAEGAHLIVDFLPSVQA